MSDATSWDPSKPILEIENLSISFFTRTREIPAVMDFSCKVMAGEAMGLVGESGCGKSTVALAVMRELGKNGKIVAGSIKFKGIDLTNMGDEGLRKIRGSQIAICRALIAKPRPVLLRRPNRVLIWPLIPTTSPAMFTSGPPELPGLTSASVTMHSA